MHAPCVIPAALCLWLLLHLTEVSVLGICLVVSTLCSMCWELSFCDAELACGKGLPIATHPGFNATACLAAATHSRDQVMDMMHVSI
jgi:hypothetical protein